MSAPYMIHWGYCQEQAEGPFADLAIAIGRLAERRALPWSHCEPEIHGDNIDLDNADGLDAAEREQIAEAGL